MLLRSEPLTGILYGDAGSGEIPGLSRE